MIDNDDLPVGKILSRREALALFGITGSAAILAACVPVRNATQTILPTPTTASEATATAAPLIPTEVANGSALPTCVVRPELTEGPLFVDEMLNRSDIRLDPSNNQTSEGTPFELTFRTSKVGEGTCTPLSGIQVDIWHCDAFGVYSDTNQLGMNTVGQKFLRGYQVTDENGIARFTTIYPGWYSGRAVHIHFKMRTSDGYDFTSQLFFDDALNDEVFATAPYSQKGNGQIRNGRDGIYRQGGEQMILNVEKTTSGFAATFDVGLQVS